MLKKLLYVGFILFWMPLSGMGIAHPGHDKVISDRELVMQAELSIQSLVDRNKLDASWSTSAQFQSIEKRYVGDEVEYMLTFKIPGMQDTDKSTLYVFMTASGDYVAANFSAR